MKSSLLLVLALGSFTASGIAAPAAAPKVLLAQAQPDKIAQVKAGTLKTAHASWWGYNKEDATEALQNAINSGVSKLIVDNMGSDWIINQPIELVSNQEIVFEDGVVIQAKKGAFKGRTDSLFTARKAANFSLIGQGNATFRMHRADYDNPKLYKKAEWRNGITLWDCSDVIIRGLTVEETGGDGLYLGASKNGYNKNILVENCVFDRNYRQGISVISAENLTIRNCKLTGTKGTAPEFGIDYEPNSSGQRLVNCVLKDTVLSGNAGGGLDIYTVNLNDTSLPVSITVNDCSFAENPVAISSTITKSATNPVVANITLNDCTFDHDRVKLRNALVGSANYLFKNCTFDFTASAGEETAAWRNVPITFTTDQAMEERLVGGVVFDGVVVKTESDFSPINFRFKTTGKVSDQISGSLSIQKDGKTTSVDLKDLIQKEQNRLATINALKPAILVLDELHAPVAGATRQGNNHFYTRSGFTFLQSAKQGEEITLNVTVQRSYGGKTEVELQDPSGQKLQSYTIPGDNKPFPITFTAEEDGVYRLVRTQTFSSRVDVNSAHPGNGLLIEGGMNFLPVKGKLYFEIPAGMKNFTIGVSTDSTADVALVNANGKVVERHNNVNTLQLFTGKRSDASHSEIWALDVSNTVWAVVVHFYGSLQPVVSTNPATLLRSST